MATPTTELALRLRDLGRSIRLIKQGRPGDVDRALGSPCRPHRYEDSLEAAR